MCQGPKLPQAGSWPWCKRSTLTRGLTILEVQTLRLSCPESFLYSQLQRWEFLPANNEPSAFHTWLSIACYSKAVCCISAAHPWLSAIAIWYHYPYGYYFLHMSQMSEKSHLLVFSFSPVHFPNLPLKSLNNWISTLCQGLSVIHFLSPECQLAVQT